jgi:thiamine-monophosphate kinase
MLQLARRLGVPCVGGDVARGEQFTAAVTVAGSLPRGTALTRGGARPGDLLFVSGNLGGSALGLSMLQSKRTARGAAVRRHLYPEPRLALGAFLRARLKVSAAMDVSDGLSMDLARLARASHAGAEINAAAVPIFPGASLRQALHGGEEYELLFTAPSSTRVPASFGGVPLTCIGRIRKRRGVVIRTGRAVELLEPLGFQHFESAS